MKKFELDDDGYPTESTLCAIRNYSGPTVAFFSKLHSVWHLASWGWREENGFKYGFRRKEYRVRRFHISTAGWSGNESLIEAMRKNYFLWHFSWIQERVGGHYIFEARSEDVVYSRKQLNDVRKKMALRAESQGREPQSMLL